MNDKYWNDLTKALEADAAKLDAMLSTEFEDRMRDKYGITQTMAPEEPNDE